MLSGVKQSRLDLPARGIEVAVLDWGGDGPLALLSHANGFCAAVWDPIARALRPSYRVVGFDARGHGDSSVPPPATGYDWEEFVGDLTAVAEVLVPECGGGRPAYGIGHSFGGTVSMAVASRRPDLLGTIAMLDPVLVPPVERDAPDRAERTASLVEGTRRRRHVWPSRAAARESWSARPPFESWDPRSLDLYLDYGMRDRADGQIELKCSGEVEGAIYAMSASLDIFGIADSLKIPALLLFAAEGQFPREIPVELARRASAMELRDVAGGHLMPMEVPNDIAAHLLEFGP